MVNLAVTSEPEETMYNILVTSDKEGESVLILRLHPSKWNKNVCALILHIQKASVTLRQQARVPDSPTS